MLKNTQRKNTQGQSLISVMIGIAVLFCSFTQVLFFITSAWAEPLQPALVEANLSRYEKDTAIACDHQNVSEAREMNANFTIQRIETQWNQVKEEIRSRQLSLNTLDRVLANRVREQLVESKDILDHERIRTEKAEGSLKTSHAKNLQQAEKNVQRLQEISESFKKRVRGVIDPLAQKYIDAEVGKVHEQITQFSRLSDRHETLLRSVQACWSSAGAPGTPGRTLYTEPEATASASPPKADPATIKVAEPDQPNSAK